MRAWIYWFTSFLLVIIGILLSVFNIFGVVFEPNPKTSNHLSHSLENIVPGYHYALNDTTVLQKMLSEPLPEFDLQQVNKEIFNSIVHTDSRYIRPYENWLLWGLALFYKPLAKTQLAERIVHESGGLCSEVTAVMVKIAQENGLEARFVGLDGHVVAEVKTSEGWRIADPDYGVIFPVGLDVLESPAGEQIIRQAFQTMSYTDDIVENYITLFRSDTNNYRMQVGMAFSPRLYTVEIIAEYLTWFIPLLFIVVGLWLRTLINSFRNYWSLFTRFVHYKRDSANV